MIRKARLTDLEELVNLGMEFGFLSQKVHTMTVDRTKIINIVYHAVMSPEMVLLVLEVNNKIEGYLLGAENTTFFSNDRVLQEMAFFCRKNLGGLKLLKAFEEEAKRRGIKKIFVGYKPGYVDLKKFYEREGYRLLELQYMKTGV